MANKERKDLNTTNGDLGNDYATSSVPISQRRGFSGTAMALGRLVHQPERVPDRRHDRCR